MPPPPRRPLPIAPAPISGDPVEVPPDCRRSRRRKLSLVRTVGDSGGLRRPEAGCFTRASTRATGHRGSEPS
jgi:hypothetical protein